MTVSCLHNLLLCLNHHCFLRKWPQNQLWIYKSDTLLGCLR